MTERYIYTEEEEKDKDTLQEVNELRVVVFDKDSALHGSALGMGSGLIFTSRLSKDKVILCAVDWNVYRG